jgi:hypothetical protein
MLIRTSAKTEFRTQKNYHNYPSKAMKPQGETEKLFCPLSFILPRQGGGSLGSLPFSGKGRERVK